ncbi:hypothetical protein [Moraxella lacunata]|uniref:hypothetical protein n=1 Tax=Moraxella lacunata TaxID=477 RepID=UPI003EE376D5
MNLTQSFTRHPKKIRNAYEQLYSHRHKPCHQSPYRYRAYLQKLADRSPLPHDSK